MVAWLGERDVVRAVLCSNLHQQQYCEGAQRVLATLLKHRVLQDDSIAFLWGLTEGECATGLCLHALTHTPSERGGGGGGGGGGAARAPPPRLSLSPFHTHTHASRHAPLPPPSHTRTRAHPPGRTHARAPPPPLTHTHTHPPTRAHTDGSTFEGVKSNAYAVLASLGPHMRVRGLGAGWAGGGGNWTTVEVVGVVAACTHACTHARQATRQPHLTHPIPPTHPPSSARAARAAGPAVGAAGGSVPRLLPHGGSLHPSPVGGHGAQGCGGGAGRAAAARRTAHHAEAGRAAGGGGQPRGWVGGGG